jgi:isopropylmalate/homocitrate/citramalate synthase
VFESPTSDIKLKAYGLSGEEVLKRGTDAVSFARQNGITVAYFAVDVEILVRDVCQWVGPNVPVHYHGHNDFGMATACGVAAARGGASWIQGTINGMGERARNADIGEIALAFALSLRGARRSRFDQGA